MIYGHSFRPNIKTLFIILLTLLGLNGYAQKRYALPANLNSSDYLANRIIVKYKQKSTGITLNAGFLNNGKSDLQPKLLPGLQIMSVKRKFPINNFKDLRVFSKNGATVPPEHDLSNIYEIQFSGPAPIDQVIDMLLLDSNVIYAEPHFLCKPSYVPSDKLYNTPGQNFLQQIHAPEAWEIVKSSAGVIIAVIDNGVDITHEDLKDNVFLNAKDPENGIDDDGDGYVDNYYGWDFGGKSTNADLEDNDPRIYSASASHGTHVSGLASAVSDNAIGIASVAFNAKLMVIKAASDDNENTISMGYEGIKYAADHGANIINCSWGTKLNSAFGKDIVDYALSKDCLIVAAAGNDNNSDPIYPAAYPGVLAVASVTAGDTKSSTSNFGDYIAIAAPGNDILSTFYQNSYVMESGTSMAAPIVSSAAALVKSQFPNLTMRQVGERLRSSADPISYKKPDGSGYLGGGRLNVQSALKLGLKSVRSDNIIVYSASKPVKNDTVTLYLDLQNYLDPIADLRVGLKSTNQYLTVLNDEISAGAFSNLETKKGIGPFKFLITQPIPDNTPVEFQISYNSTIDSFNAVEYFQKILGVDYLNVNVNAIETTFTGNGRIGYSGQNQKNGVGFIYNHRNLLFESSLLIGRSTIALSDNARNGNGGDEDFINTLGVTRLGSDTAEFVGVSEFNDSGNESPLNILIKHKQIAFAAKPNDKYTIAEYEIFNSNGVDLDGIYAGLFTDWDIDKSSKDITSFDSFKKLAYSYGRFGNTPFAGVKLLNNTTPVFYCPLSIDLPGNPLSNGFSKTDKYKAISSGIAGISLGEKSTSGIDVAFVTGYGPYQIQAHKSIKIAFAFIAGDNLDDIEKQAETAERKYQSLSNEEIRPPLILKQNFPNPANGRTQFQFSIPSDGMTKFEVYNNAGLKVATLIDKNLQAGNYAIVMNTTGYPPGIYIYTLRFNQYERALKMILK